MRCRHPLRTKKTHPSARSPLRDSMCHTVIFCRESKPEKKDGSFNWKIQGEGGFDPWQDWFMVPCGCLSKFVKKKTLSHFNVKVNFSRPMKPIRQNLKSPKNQKKWSSANHFCTKNQKWFFWFQNFSFFLVAADFLKFSRSAPAQLSL